MLKEFKDFLMKGNIVDLAVAFVIGVAFAAVVNSLVNDLIMPIIAMIIGKPSFNDLTFTINDAVFRYGAFITSLITFVSIAAAVFFFVVKPMDAIKARTAKQEEETVSDEERRHQELLAALERLGRRPTSSASRPTVSPGGRPRSRSSASSTPGTNASREVVSWRIVRISPGPAEDDLLVGDETRQPDGVDRHLTAHPGRRRLRGARGRVELRVGVQLDDLGVRERT